MPLPNPLDALARVRREAAEADDRLQRQLEACVAAGYTSAEIAAALGVGPAVVRMKRAWRERKACRK